MTAAVLAPAAVAAVLWLPTPFLAALVAILILGALWEWTLLAGLEERLPRVAYLTANAMLMSALVWGAGRGLFTLKLVSLVGVVWWGVAALWLWRSELFAADTAAARIVKLLAGSLAAVPAWCALGWLHAQPGNGPGWALFALGLVWAADTFAYFVGVRFGRNKLAPAISPGKTWEGVAGGFAGCLLLAVLATPALDIPWTQLHMVLLLSVVVMAVSVQGDLFESLLKRHAGAKDSGTLIPGHGGLLDRIDSLLAALPVFAILKFWLSL
jgi:phosphatidate cytidylyltransferase